MLKKIWKFEDFFVYLQKNLVVQETFLQHHPQGLTVNRQIKYNNLKIKEL